MSMRDVPFIGGCEDFDEDEFFRKLDEEQDYSPEFIEWMNNDPIKIFPHEISVAYYAWCAALKWRESNGAK